MVILGIDPGTSRVGYGAIQKRGGTFTYITSGLLPVPPGDFSSQLFAIHTETKNILSSVRPDRVGVEELYFFKNQKTVIRVAEARGVLLFTCAEAGVPVLEVTPLQVKLGVAGSGVASKQEVASMVFRFLRIPPRSIPDDVTDALAVALAVSQRNAL